MAATATVLAQLNSSSAGAQTGVTASFTPAANSKLVVLAIALNNNHTTSKVWTISGGSLSWQDGDLGGPYESLVGANFDAEIDVEWADVGSSPSSMTVTVDAYASTQTAWYGITVYEVVGSQPGVFGNLQAVDFHNPGASAPTLALATGKTANSVLLATIFGISDGAAPAWAADPSGWTVATKPTGTDAVNVAALTSTTDSDAALSGYGTTTNTTEMFGVLLEIGEYDGLVEQAGFRFYEDDGAETATTPTAAQNTDVTAPLGAKLLRFLLQTTDDVPATAWKLQHQIDGAGGYADTPVGASVVEAWGTVTFGAIGTGANGSTSVAPSYPTGITDGQYLVCVVTSGATNSETPTTPSGWALLATGASTDGTYGVDAGPRRVTVFGREADGTESGTLTVNITNGGTCRGTISRFTKAGSGAWVVDGYGANDSTSGTGVSMTFASVNWHDGDAVLVATGQRVDSATQSSQSLTATGITFGTRTNRAATAVTTGNDHRHTVDTFAAVSGAAPSESAAPTWAYTASAAASAGGVLVRLREYTAPLDNPVYIAPSTNIAGGGEATTQRLTGGTGSFTTGRRWDDENGTDTINPAADGNTELEFSVALQDLVDTQFVDFRLTPLDTYTEVPRWTVGSGGPVTGTGSLAYGGAVAVTGTPTRLGTASVGYGGSMAATGQAQRLGTASLAYGGSVTATGTIPPVTGTAVLAYGGAVAGSGTPTRLGTGAAAYGGAVAVTGQPTRLGTGALAYGGAVVASGQAVEQGSTALAYGGTVAATGQATRLGTAALAYSGSVVATGSIPTDVVTGTAVLAYGGAVTVTGLATRLGTAVVGYGGTVVASGQAVELGTGSAGYGGAVAGTGTAVRLGTGALAYGGSVTATGTTPGGPVVGTGALAYGGTVTGSGQAQRLGTGSVGYGGSVAATGRCQRLGTVAAAYGGSVVATGTIPTEAVTGTGSLAYGGSVAGTGTPVRLGSGAAGYGGSVAGTGTAVRLGAAALAYGGVRAVTGQPVRVGVGSVAYGAAQVAATGTAVRVGVGVVAYGGTLHGLVGVEPKAPVPPTVGGFRLAAQGSGFAIRGRRPGFGPVSSVFGRGRQR